MALRYFGHSAFEITSLKGKIIYIDPSIEGNPTCPIKLQDITEVDLVSVILEPGRTYEFITKSK